MDGKTYPISGHLRCLGEAFGRFFADDGLVHAGNLAFLGMLSLFPFLIFLVALSGFFGQSESGTAAINFLLEALPPEVARTVQGPIDSVVRNTGGGILTISVLFALFTASSGVDAARAAVVRAYGAEYKKPVWRQRLESLAVVIIAAVLAILGMALQIIGPTLLGLLERFVTVPESVYSLWNLARYLISPLAVLIALFGLFLALTPHAAFPRIYRLPGCFFALVVWMATATGFSAFLKYAGRFDVTYGGLAGVVVAQVFLFIVSIGFIVGAEINSAYSRRDLRLKEAAKAEPAEAKAAG